MTDVCSGLFVDYTSFPGICYCCREVMWIGCSWSTELCHCSYLLFLSDSAKKGSFFWFLNLQYLTKKGLFSLTLITNSCSADNGLLPTCHISSLTVCTSCPCPSPLAYWLSTWMFSSSLCRSRPEWLKLHSMSPCV